MVMKMTGCTRLQVRASGPPTWRVKDVAENHGLLWGQSPLLVRQGGIALHKEQTSVGQRGRDHTSNLPRFRLP